MPKITSTPVEVPLGNASFASRQMIAVVPPASASYSPSVGAYGQRGLTHQDGAGRRTADAYRRNEVPNTMQGQSRHPVNDVRGRYLPVSPRGAAGWRTSAKGERTKAWVESLGGGPQVGRSTAIERSSTTRRENANLALVADRTEEEGGGEQSALAEGPSLARYNPSIGNIRMRDSWVIPTFNVASTTPTASMHNPNKVAGRVAVQSSKPARKIGPTIRGGAPVGQDTLANVQQRYLPSSSIAVKSKISILVVNFPIVTLYTR
jgi:hypothetical protein